MPLDVTLAYQQIADKPNPNPMQEEMFRTISSQDCAVLLKAQTGSGKTEAVVVPCLAANIATEGDAFRRRLFLILPARSLVDDQVQRLHEKIFPRASAMTQRPLSLVVDTGVDSVRYVWRDGKEIAQACRHLYDGDVIVTTLDKFLYRFFGYGEKFKNYVFPFRIHYGTRRALFCFDEAHSYEDVAFTNFVDLVRTLAVDKGHDVVVMTATMPKDYQHSLGFLDEFDFTSGSRYDALHDFYRTLQPNESKRLVYAPCPNDQLVPNLIAKAKENFADNRRVIVTAERVEDVIIVFDALADTYGNHVLLYHGRLPDHVEGHSALGRREIYRTLKGRDENEQGYVLVTTSAIEVGCDLDAHTLITEICNPAQLLQRAGRCNRRGKTIDAQVIVVGEKIKSFLREMDDEDESEYRHMLESMSGQPLDAQKITKCIKKRAQFDYRVQMIFKMLYEYVYEANRLYARLHEKGIVITRSWEPTIILTTNRGTMANMVSVNIPSCVADKPDDMDQDCQVFHQRYLDDGSHSWSLEKLRFGGSAYNLDLIAEVPEQYFDPQRGYIKVPQIFRWGKRDGYRQSVGCRGQDKDVWLWYLRPLEKLSEGTETSQLTEEEEDADEHKS